MKVKEVQLSDDMLEDELIVRMIATDVCHTDVTSANMRSSSVSKRDVEVLLILRGVEKRRSDRLPL